VHEFLSKVIKVAQYQDDNFSSNSIPQYFSPSFLHLGFASPQINLEDFRSIVSPCNMLQEPEKRG